MRTKTETAAGIEVGEHGAPLLRLEDVKKEYVSDGQPVRALDGVTLEVAEGEFVALVGRSGCGKSTLLNLAGAMDFPTQRASVARRRGDIRPGRCGG